MSAAKSFLPIYHVAGKPPSSILRSTARLTLQAYYWQYISIVLIILTCVIGAFVRQPAKAAIKVPATAAALEKAIPLKGPVLREREIGSLKFKDLFEPGQTFVDGSKVTGLTQLLLSHDVDVEVEIFSRVPREGVPAGQQMNLAMARSVALFKFLIDEKVPVAALRIFAVEKQADEAQAEVKMYRVVE